MPLNMMVPLQPVRVAQNQATTVGANSDSPKALMFTVPIGRKYIVFGLGTDQTATGVDLIAFHIIGTQAVALIDIPCNRLPTDEHSVMVYETFAAGESLTFGIRNRTASGITPQLVMYYLDQPA
jgi:hypothetical protein